MTIRLDDELFGMREVGRLVARTLEAMARLVAPGVTTRDLDRAGEACARAAGAYSAPQLTYGFPGVTCISVNEGVVHGVPGSRVIKAGDVVKLDVTLELNGYMADSAMTVLVPPVHDDAHRVSRATIRAFERGLDAARVGRTLKDVGAAVAAVAREEGVVVLRQLSGHGIGRKLHEPPDVPNWPDPGATLVLQHGMVLALEPMFSVSDSKIVEDGDGWTLRTKRRSLAAHHEHTIMVRDGDSPLILTAA
jgi:methionyl aminopeptidase